MDLDIPEKPYECKVQAQHLRKLWHWVVSSTPTEPGDFRHLDAASEALGEILDAGVLDDGRPALPGELPVNGLVPCSFKGFARFGFAVALAQAITGKNHPQKEPAPFGSIRFMIVPLAAAVGALDSLVLRCPMLKEAP